MDSTDLILVGAFVALGVYGLRADARWLREYQVFAKRHGRGCILRWAYGYRGFARSFAAGEKPPWHCTMTGSYQAAPCTAFS